MCTRTYKCTPASNIQKWIYVYIHTYLHAFINVRIYNVHSYIGIYIAIYVVSATLADAYIGSLRASEMGQREREKEKGRKVGGRFWGAERLNLRHIIFIYIYIYINTYIYISICIYIYVNNARQSVKGGNSCRVLNRCLFCKRALSK